MTGCIRRNGGNRMDAEQSVRVVRCKSMRGEHSRSRRAYAHVFHQPNQICIAKELEQLPEEIGVAILLHEIGHLLAGPDKGERAANIAIEKYSGIPIRYEDTPYGKKLETINPRQVMKGRKILRKWISQGIAV